MSLFPKLIGEVEIMERRQRYVGEPRYKRLSFVRPKKSTDTDEWDVIRSANPRYIQAAPIYYDVPQYPQYPQYPQLGPYHHHQQQQQLPYPAYHPSHQQQHHYPQYQLQHHPAHGNFHPPSQYGDHNLEYREPRRIEGPRNEMIQLKGGHDGYDDDNDIVDVVDYGPRRVSTPHRWRSQSRSRSRRRLRANSVYSSDDSSDDDYRGSRQHYRRPHRRSIRYDSDSDDDLVRYRRSHSRSRSRPRPLRGW